jgi:hypothetical protein
MVTRLSLNASEICQIQDFLKRNLSPSSLKPYMYFAETCKCKLKGICSTEVNYYALAICWLIKMYFCARHFSASLALYFSFVIFVSYE